MVKANNIAEAARSQEWMSFEMEGKNFMAPVRATTTRHDDGDDDFVAPGTEWGCCLICYVRTLSFHARARSA